jgi:PAS domain S-box-containing protein
MHSLGNLNSGEFNSQGSKRINSCISGIVSDYFWDQFFDSADDYVAVIDTECHLLRLNNQMADRLGIAPGTDAGRICEQCVHHNNGTPSDCPVWRAIKSGKDQTGDVKDSRLGQIQVKVQPFFDSEGKVSCLLLVASDQTKLKTEISVPEIFGSGSHALINSMPEAILICDSSGTILTTSNKFRELFFLPPHNSPDGSNLLSFLMHGYIETSLSDFLSVSNGVKTFTKGQYKMRRSNSESFWAEISFSPLTNFRDNRSYILVEIRDISETLQSEESLNKNYIRLTRLHRTFTQFSPDSVSNIHQLIALFGELLGASVCSYYRLVNGNSAPVATWSSPLISGIMPDSGYGEIVKLYKREQQDFLIINKPFNFSDANLGNFIDQNGVAMTVIQTVKSNNKPVGLITALFTYNYLIHKEDIEFCNIIASATAVEESRISTQKAREESELNYRELFDFITDAIYILNPEGEFIDVNLGATRMYGYSREELIGSTPAMLSAEGRNDLELNNRYIAKAFNGESQNFEWWGKRKNGEIFAKDVVLNRGRYFGNDVVIAIGRDVTERRQAEDKLQEYNAELKATNASKDKFFSILAHDLKNPFQGLLGFIDLLVEDIDELEKQQVKDYLQNIRSASYQTYSLLENLLEWSRIQTGRTPFQPTVFELTGEIEEVFSLLGSNAMRKGIKLVSKVAAGLNVEADRNMAHSIIQNLVSNAIKFSNSYGTVTVEAYKVDSPKPGVESADNRTWLKIDVIDNGVGIPDDVLPQLFKLDGQVSMVGTANEPGTGLGLILCKEMVEKNGGKIWVTSEPGRGSTFSFTLPLYE